MDTPNTKPWARFSYCQCFFSLLWREDSRVAPEGSSVAGILSGKWLQSRRADGGARRFLGLEWDAIRSEVMGKKFVSLMGWLMLVIS